MRALRRDVLPTLDLAATGMEFASEMVIKAPREGPRRRASSRSSYHPRVRGVEALSAAGRLAPSAADSRLQPDLPLCHPGRRDGACWGRFSCSRVRARDVVRPEFFIHTLIVGALLIVVGVAGGRARVLRARVRRLPARRPGSMARAHALHGSGSSTGCCSAALVSLAGLALGRSSSSVGRAGLRHPRRGAARDPRRRRRSSTGIQVFFTSFLLSILGLRRPS